MSRDKSFEDTLGFCICIFGSLVVAAEAAVSTLDFLMESSLRIPGLLVIASVVGAFVLGFTVPLLLLATIIRALDTSNDIREPQQSSEISSSRSEDTRGYSTGPQQVREDEVGWLKSIFTNSGSPTKRRSTESNREYRNRLHIWSKEAIVSRATGNTPKRGILESEKDYRGRVAQEANERILEKAGRDAPRKGIFESGSDYRSRIAVEANKRIIEEATGSAPEQGFFESDDSYKSRVATAANERIIESATGRAPEQGLFETKNNYESRVTQEAQEATGEGEDGCFLTTACVCYAGLPDNCDELMTLRRFRDRYVFTLEGGPEILTEYYRIAPRILIAINSSPARDETLSSIWETIKRTIRAIEEGNHSSALQAYSEMFETLRRRYLLETGDPRESRVAVAMIFNSELEAKGSATCTREPPVD